jgi:hypothetical protein
MTEHIAWLAEYDAWLAERARVVAAEEAGNADPDDWSASDDSGIELLHDVVCLLKRGVGG